MKILRRLRSLFCKDRLDAEMTEEMEAHLAAVTARNILRGMSATEARYAAERQFGNVAGIQEKARDARGWVWVGQGWQDVAYGARSLRKNPAFAGVAILTLALSLGSCLAIFSVVDSLLLRPLDNPEPDRLVTLRSRSANTPDLPVSPADFIDWEREARSFSAMTARTEAIWTLTGEGEPRRMRTIHVTGNYFDVLGVSPPLGRAFLPEEIGEQPVPVVMISYALWQNVFGGREDVLGRQLRLNEENFTVVGVLPENLERAGGLIGWSDIALPLIFTRESLVRRAWRAAGLTVQARLKPGVSAAEAQAEMDVLTARLAEQFPDANRGIGASVNLTGELMTRSIGPALWSLFGAVAGVLLIACANVTSLLLVRATVRQREISLRVALGATRSRVLRQLLTESLLLAVAGGALGVLLAAGGIHLISNLRFHNSVGLAQLALIKLDPGLLGVAVGLTLGTGLLFGFAPAWLASRTELAESLKAGARGSTEGGGRGRFRGALVIFEVAAACMLLVCAGLLVRSFVRLANFDPGFDPRPIAYANVTLPGAHYLTGPVAQSDRKITAFTDEVLTRLRALPGVESAGVTNVLAAITVGDSRSYLTFSIEGSPELPVNERPRLQWNCASPDYFATMGIRLLRGRTFTEHDHAQAPRVAVISESAAKMHFPGRDPLGQRIKVDSGRFSTWSEIVGIVSDTVLAYGQERTAQVYESFPQVPLTYLHFAVRTSGDPAVLAPMLTRAIHAVDPNLAVPWAAPMTQTIGAISTLARQRFIVQLLAVFSGAALAIAMVGIYGVISYSVSRRTHEIGIRMALGAHVTDVLRLVLGQGFRLVGVGLLLGLIGSVAAGRAIETMLYRTSSLDPLTLGLVMLLLAGTGLLACWLPARRAAKVDPMIALRAE